MSTIDAPDWQRIVFFAPAMSSVDAPDWERVVTGPGGAGIGGLTLTHVTGRLGADMAIPAATLTTVFTTAIVQPGFYLLWTSLYVTDTSGAANPTTDGFGFGTATGTATQLVEAVAYLPANGSGMLASTAGITVATAGTLTVVVWGTGTFTVTRVAALSSYAPGSTYGGWQLSPVTVV